MPPGVYDREMKVTTFDGETLVISDLPDLPQVLKTVTVLGPPVETPSVGGYSPSKPRLAATAVLAIVLIGFGTAILARKRT